MDRLLEYFWENLSPDTEKNQRFASKKILKLLYEAGLVEKTKYSLERWVGHFKQFSSKGDGFLVKKEDLSKVGPLLFKGKIKKPFDPFSLQDGLRDQGWLPQFYNKVLAFETYLNAPGWEKIVTDEIKKAYFKGDQLFVDANFKGFITELLTQYSSPLRYLELWYHGKPADPQLAGVHQGEGHTNLIKDAFEKAPKSQQNKAALDKIYYRQGQAPVQEDQENLSFLEELAKGSGD